MQYWQIFSSFLIFWCYFTRLKAREISCKKWETRNIFLILHSAPRVNNYLSYVKEYKCLKKVIHQIDNKKNEWLLLSTRFTATFELVFVLTLQIAFSWRFHFKANRKSIGSLKKDTRHFQNSPPFERSTCFYVTSSGNFKRFQYFEFETNFLENKSLFQKNWVPFFSWK